VEHLDQEVEEQVELMLKVEQELLIQVEEEVDQIQILVQTLQAEQEDQESLL
jgi:hypothetical protein